MRFSIAFFQAVLADCKSFIFSMGFWFFGAGGTAELE
jgi:hypothetical protein